MNLNNIIFRENDGFLLGREVTTEPFEIQKTLHLIKPMRESGGNEHLYKIMDKIVGIGVPGIMLMVAISMTGLSGAAITSALALLGSGGMIWGIITLVVAGAVASAIAEYGFDALLKAVIKKLYAKGETKSSIRAEIEKGPWSKKLKAKTISDLNRV